MQQQEQTGQPQLFTVARFADKHRTWLTQPAIRNLILNAETRLNSRGEKIPGNGLAEAGAILRVGRKVLINEPALLSWLREQQKHRRAAA